MHTIVFHTDDFWFTDALGSPPMDRRTGLAIGQLMESALPDVLTVIEDIREEGDGVVVTSHWAGTLSHSCSIS